MKKIQFTIIGLIAILLFSCNPNKDIYEELDAMQAPYHETFSYELTPEDYTIIKSLALENALTAEDSAIAYDVATFMSFSDIRQAALMVPAFLEASFIALDTASAISITYNYSYEFTFSGSQQLTFLDTVINDNDIATNGFDLDYSDTLAYFISDPEKDDIVIINYKWGHYGADTTFEPRFKLYQFDGSTWVNPANAYELTFEDYESFGAAYTQPGYYHAFDYKDSKKEDYYLTRYMGIKFPYAIEGDEIQVVYKKYYGGGQYGMHYNKLFFDGTEWSWNEQKSDQFIHNGPDFGWVFDPTISYYLQKSDFQILVEWTGDNDTLNGYLNLSYPANTEDYFGASSYYGNFDMRQSVRLGNDPNGYLTDLSEAEIDELIYNRLILGVQIIIENDFPDAQPFSNGVPVYYEISFDAYNGKHVDYMIKYLCTSTGTFEYVEGPTALE